MCWSFFVPFSIFLPWCVLFSRCSLSNRRKTGPPNRCKATPLWRGQRVNESSGNLYMRQSWLPQWTARSMFFYNVFSLCQIEQTMFTEQSKPLSTFQPSKISVVSMRWQNSPATRLGNRPCLAHLQVTEAPITVLETSSALRPCKLHQMTTEPSQPLRISRYIERHTFAHLQVMTTQTNVLATSEGHQRPVLESEPSDDLALL